jgi:hypothetical protein
MTGYYLSGDKGCAGNARPGEVSTAKYINALSARFTSGARRGTISNRFLQDLRLLAG